MVFEVIVSDDIRVVSGIIISEVIDDMTLSSDIIDGGSEMGRRGDVMAVEFASEPV